MTFNTEMKINARMKINAGIKNVGMKINAVY